MVDIKPFIAEQLKNLGTVELSFNDSLNSLPVIVLTETENRAETVIENCDRISRITIQLDIYAENFEKAEAIAVEASGILTARGLRRGFSQTITDERVPRHCMRFSCGIDEASGRILTI